MANYRDLIIRKRLRIEAMKLRIKQLAVDIDIEEAEVKKMEKLQKVEDESTR